MVATPLHNHAECYRYLLLNLHAIHDDDNKTVAGNMTKNCCNANSSFAERRSFIEDNRLTYVILHSLQALQKGGSNQKVNNSSFILLRSYLQTFPC